MHDKTLTASDTRNTPPAQVNIIRGALDLTNKTAKAAMTPIDMVFMLPADAPLNEVTLTAILASGHSRIPIYRPGNRCAMVSY